MSPKQRKALKALHSARRGRRVHPDSRERETVLAEVASALRYPLSGIRSIRVLAAYCRVHERTVRRWLSGEHWPPETAVRRMAQWARQHRRP